jgi:hypothetical protein
MASCLLFEPVMPIRHASPLLLVLLVGVGWARPSRADSPAPTCAGYQSLVTCDAANLGNACPSGGQCDSLFCRGDASMTIYKCVAGSDAGPAVDSSLQSGGCDIVARATGPGAIAFGLLLIGAATLLLDRKRQARR